MWAVSTTFFANLTEMLEGCGQIDRLYVILEQNATLKHQADKRPNAVGELRLTIGSRCPGCGDIADRIPCSRDVAIPCSRDVANSIRTRRRDVTHSVGSGGGDIPCKNWGSESHTECESAECRSKTNHFFLLVNCIVYWVVASAGRVPIALVEAANFSIDVFSLFKGCATHRTRECSRLIR
jgi:hypothetical protein